MSPILFQFLKQRNSQNVEIVMKARLINHYARGRRRVCAEPHFLERPGGEEGPPQRGRREGWETTVGILPGDYLVEVAVEYEVARNRARKVLD